MPSDRVIKPAAIVAIVLAVVGLVVLGALAPRLIGWIVAGSATAGAMGVKARRSTVRAGRLRAADAAADAERTLSESVAREEAAHEAAQDAADKGEGGGRVRI